MSTETQKITILVLDYFAMIAFASTVEPLREANWVCGRQAFEWKVVSPDGEPVRASNGLSLNVDCAMQDAPAGSMVIVCSSFNPHLVATPPVLAWLRRQDRSGAMIGGVETGAYVLARAGLLNGHRATIHWENSESFEEEFPDVEFTDAIFELDRRRFSASGAAAALDMMLYFIGQHLGQKVASGVAEEFIYNRIRKADSPQRLTVSDRMNTRNPRLRRLLSHLEKNLHVSMDVAEMAALEKISEREVRRLFDVHIGTSPGAYHLKLRLAKAQSILRQSDTNVSSVALDCGFSSSSAFSRAYKREFNRRPKDDSGSVYFADD